MKTLTEWDISKSKYSYTTYKLRFGGWTNACLQFIEFKMGKQVLVEDPKLKDVEIAPQEKIDTQDKEAKREIPLKLRLQVLQRDKFRCVFCGNSPAINWNTVLHIDHVLPYSKGGKTALDNFEHFALNAIGEKETMGIFREYIVSAGVG